MAPPAAANPIELDHVLADAMVLIETWCCVCTFFHFNFPHMKLADVKGHPIV